ncbi:MFS transporter [Ravibacter arvi]|uniref:MFS transporter n=1 Tax=Ravibacter arvi TaxID=2051041 RepID=A0ABP8LRA5_9BACT
MKINNYRWLIVALVLVATTINYVDRQVIGLLKPILEVEFGWSESDYSRIVMAFSAAYAVGLLTMGRMVDFLGTKKGYSIAVIIWSLAGMLHAVSRNMVQFVTVRIVLGIGEAGNFPAAMKVVSEWFPKKEKGIATGIINAGASLGVVAALLVTPLILNFYTWKEVFWITGGLGFAWLILWWIFYEIPMRQKRITQQELDLIVSGQEQYQTQSGKPMSWKKLLSLPQTWAVVVGKFFIDPIYWFFLFWLPSYFSLTYGLDLKKPSLPLMVIYLATTTGSIVGGYISSALIKKGWTTVNARKYTLLMVAVLELMVISMQFIHHVWIAVAVLSTAVALHQTWSTNIFTLTTDLFPKESVSSVAGIAGMAGAIGGFLFPMFVGDLLDRYKLAGNLSGGYNLLFSVCGITYLGTWLIIHLLTKQFKRHAV